MKTTYTTPESEIIGLSLENNILSGEKFTGSNSGQNMDSADYSQNPF